MAERKKSGIYIISMVGCVVAVSLWWRCAPSRTVIIRHSVFRQQLVRADSLFSTGNYEHAKMEYLAVREKCPEPAITAIAQYRLGYVNIYYDNPFADHEAALREFQRFQALYPSHDKIEEVQNWIRILVVLKNYSRDFTGKTDVLKNINEQRQDIIKNYTTLQEAYLRCDGIRDSLVNEVKALERLIIRLQEIK